MTTKILSENVVHFIKGLDAVADAFDGTVYSDVVDVSAAKTITFLVHKGVGATGTSTLTVQPCDDVTPSNTGTSVAFNYRICTSGDTWGALTAAAAAGFDTTAGSSQLYAVEVDTDVMAASGYKYCRLKCVEVVNSPVLGGIVVMLSGLRYAGDSVASQID